MKRRMICFMMVVVLLFTFATPAFALDSGINNEVAMQNEIEERKAIAYADLHRQLAQQDALDMFEIFQQYLDAEIEAEVRAQYGIPGDAEVNSGNFVFTYGGYVAYNGISDSKVMITVLDEPKGREYILNQFGISMADIIDGLLGTIPHWLVNNPIFSALSMVHFVIDTVSNYQIAQNDYYAKLMVVSSDGAATTATYAYPWTTYPYLYVESASTLVGHGFFNQGVSYNTPEQLYIM